MILWEVENHLGVDWTVAENLGRVSMVFNITSRCTETFNMPILVVILIL